MSCERAIRGAGRCCIGGFRSTFTAFRSSDARTIMAARRARGSDATLRARAANCAGAPPIAYLRAAARRSHCDAGGTTVRAGGGCVALHCNMKARCRPWPTAPPAGSGAPDAPTSRCRSSASPAKSTICTTMQLAHLLLTVLNGCVACGARTFREACPG